MTKQLAFEEKLAPIVTPILVLIITAGASFVVGANYQASKDESNVKAAAQSVGTDASESSSNSISEIESSLTKPAPPTSPPTSPDSPAKSSSAPKTPSSSGTTAKTASPDGLIHINSATVAELDTLPGIGPKYAQAIIDYRSQNGPFVRVDDLVNVKGIGPKTLEKLRAKIAL